MYATLCQLLSHIFRHLSCYPVSAHSLYRKRGTVLPPLMKRERVSVTASDSCPDRLFPQISSPRYRTPFIAKCICLTAWSVSALLMLPIFLYANTVVNYDNTTHCNIYWPQGDIMNGQKAFTLYAFTLSFFIPSILILLFYFLVICKLRTVGPKNKSKEKKRSHRKVTILVLTVITVYVLCWLPYWIGQVILRSPRCGKLTSRVFQVYITTLPSGHLHSDAGLTFLLLAGCLSYANSAVNPILYAFLSENFKKSFSKAFTCADKEVNAHLNPENSANARTMRVNSNRGPNKLSSKKDRTRLQDHFADTAVSRGFSGISAENHVSTLPTDLDNEDFDEEDGDEDEVLDLDDSLNMIPMTSRVTSYAACVESREHLPFEGETEVLLERRASVQDECLASATTK